MPALEGGQRRVHHQRDDELRHRQAKADAERHLLGLGPARRRPGYLPVLLGISAPDTGAAGRRDRRAHPRQYRHARRRDQLLRVPGARSAASSAVVRATPRPPPGPTGARRAQSAPGGLPGGAAGGTPGRRRARAGGTRAGWTRAAAGRLARRGRVGPRDGRRAMAVATCRPRQPHPLGVGPRRLVRGHHPLSQRPHLRGRQGPELAGPEALDADAAELGPEEAQHLEPHRLAEPLHQVAAPLPDHHRGSRSSCSARSWTPTSSAWAGPSSSRTPSPSAPAPGRSGSPFTLTR